MEPKTFLAEETEGRGIALLIFLPAVTIVEHNKLKENFIKGKREGGMIVAQWIIRAAERRDIDQLARVHVDSWLTTYRGIVPDSYLDNMKLGSRIELWTRVLDPSNETTTFVLDNPAGEVAGFINGGICRDQELDIEAEVYSLYMLQEAQGKGHGRRLMERMIVHFREQGYDSMLVWVLEDNPASILPENGRAVFDAG